MKEIDASYDVISIEYVPKTGRNKGQLYEQFYIGDKYNLFAWLSDVAEIKDGVAYKRIYKERIGILLEKQKPYKRR